MPAMLRRLLLSFLFAVVSLGTGWSPVVAQAELPPKLPVVPPDEVGFDPAALSQIDEVVAAGIDAGEMPGAVVLVARGGRVAWLKAYGQRVVEPEPIEMTTDAVFDLASITKPVATATSVMLLIESGRVGLDDPVALHIPEFAENGKADVTVAQLLTHQSGLIADNSLKDYDADPLTSFQRINALSLQASAGTRFRYSDVGFLVLGELVERVSGRNVHEFSQEHIFRPLGMTDTGYVPSAELRTRCTPTEKRNGEWIQGEVHDPRAHRLEGIAGHAGLFSTAADLAVYAQMLLGRGEYAAVRILQPETVDLMAKARHVPGDNRRTLGWDARSGYSSNRGEGLSDRAFGHGGFTGTVLWIDPGLDLFYIFLSSRLHPDGKGTVNPLAGRIGSIVAAAVQDAPSP